MVYDSYSILYLSIYWITDGRTLIYSLVYLFVDIPIVQDYEMNLPYMWFLAKRPIFLGNGL